MKLQVCCTLHPHTHLHLVTVALWDIQTTQEETQCLVSVLYDMCLWPKPEDFNLFIKRFIFLIILKLNPEQNRGLKLDQLVLSV